MSKPVFVRKLTKTEESKLIRMVHSSQDGRIVRRAQIVRLSSQGKKAAEIAQFWAISIPTVLQTIHRFNAEGLKGLVDKPRRGRPAKATDQYVALLKQAVQTSPRDLGYPFSSWTLNRLREYLGRQTGKLLNPRYLSQLMAKHGVVYRRPKHVMSHLRDPKDYNEKKALLEFLKNAQQKGKPASIFSTSTNVKFTSTQP